jgi:hypothetical protein
VVAPAGPAEEAAEILDALQALLISGFGAQDHGTGAAFIVIVPLPKLTGEEAEHARTRPMT